MGANSNLAHYLGELISEFGQKVILRFKVMDVETALIWAPTQRNIVSNREPPVDDKSTAAESMK